MAVHSWVEARRKDGNHPAEYDKLSIFNALELGLNMFFCIYGIEPFIIRFQFFDYEILFAFGK